MWAILAILSAILFAAVKIIDKIVLTKWVKDPLVPGIVTGFVNLFAGIKLWQSFADNKIAR